MTAHRFEPKVKSRSPTDGLLMTLDRMRDVKSVDTAARLTTVQAGIRLADLVHALARDGLGLSILGSISRQSVAGAISTATHGSSLLHANLSSFVVGMRLVTARGEILSLDEDDERLPAARVGLGALGVITEVTLRCEPLFTLIEETRRISVDRLIGELDTIAHSAEYVKIAILSPTGQKECLRGFQASINVQTPVL